MRAQEEPSVGRKKDGLGLPMDPEGRPQKEGAKPQAPKEPSRIPHLQKQEKGQEREEGVQGVDASLGPAGLEPMLIGEGEKKRRKKGGDPRPQLSKGSSCPGGSVSPRSSLRRTA